LEYCCRLLLRSLDFAGMGAGVLHPNALGGDFRACSNAARLFGRSAESKRRVAQGEMPTAGFA
jgi:hypothetical protein